MMNDRDMDLVKSILGEDIFEELEKSAVVKLNTKTGVEPDEIKIALQIVPRSILSYLFANLRHKKEGDICDLDLPFAPDAKMHLVKRGPDNYSGEITQDGKRVVELQNRSLPSVGLILLSTFELYDMSLLDEIKKDSPKTEEKAHKLQDIIDERLSMHCLIRDVVDRRISERDAIKKLIQENLSGHILEANRPEEEESMDNEDKKSKLKQFLDGRDRKRQESIELDKSEIKCPDCDTTIYKGEKIINLCVCYGEHMNKEIKIQKTEDGSKVKLKFPKSFDIDNIEMLLDALKNK